MSCFRSLLDILTSTALYGEMNFAELFDAKLCMLLALRLLKENII